MGSRSEKSREFFAMFGTPFEELEESEAASKKPLSVENQIVTDEKGRRRFHGAFTGGFSAGYFNTVGTKEGWAPSTFKSTRGKREDQQARRPEDFMDSEDFSEYGIAPRKIRTTQAFTEDVGQSTSTEKRRFAGESTADIEAVADRLSDLIRPVSDSIGVKLMRSMGWRPGKGVGSAQTALIREREKDAVKSYGCELPPGGHDNELAAVELESMAPGFQFAPSDVDFVKFEPKADLHGLGYKGLDVERHLKSAKSLEKESALKTSAQQKRGIRGQAFGVGAFEDDDDDLFTTEDLSNYDFTLGGSESREKQATSTGDFLPASKPQPPRQFFQPPKLPRDYAPSVASSTSAMKERPRFEDTTPRNQEQSRNALQRANVLDESHSVWSLVSAEDRQRIEAIKAGQKVEPAANRTQEAKHQDRKKDQPKEKPKTEEVPAPFSDDPKKRARFQDFVNYLKRGLCPPQPPDVTEWDWEVEQIEFRKHLPPDLVAVEDDARARQKPLAGTKIASVFTMGFKSKFTKGAYGEEDMDNSGGKVMEDEDKVKAVQMKMFGAMTREKHEWHPDKNLCKRFNLPNPYPDSKAVGIPYLKKETKPGFFTLNFETVTTPSMQTEQTDSKKPPVFQESKEPFIKVEPPATDEYGTEQPSTSASSAMAMDQPEEEETRPPISLFRAIFAETSSSSSESEEEKDVEPPSEPSSALQEPAPPPERPQLRFIRRNERMQSETDGTSLSSTIKAVTIPEEVAIDLDAGPAGNSNSQAQEGPGLYGPALPPETTELGLPPTSVIRRHKHEKKRHRHKTHKKKAESSSRKHRKHKKEKKKKKSKRRSDSSEKESSDNGSDTDES